MTRFLAIALCLLSSVSIALAHGGDDHAHEDEPAAATSGPAPQVEASGGGLELVASVADRKLRIYLDRADTNAPVDGATIALFADGVPAGTAKALGAGTYEIAAPFADEPGTKPLKFVVTAGDAKTELSAPLEIAAAVPPAASPVAWGTLLLRPEAWAFAGLAAAFGFVLAFAFRPRRLPAEPQSASAHADAPIKRIASLALIATLALAAHGGRVWAHGDDDHSHDEPMAAQTTATSVPQRLPDGDVYLPKATQRLLHIRTVVAAPQTTRESRELIGTVVPDPTSFGQVQAPMDGRIELAERGISHVGQRVAAGEVLAYLSPNIPIADLGTMQQLRAEVAGKLKIAEQKLARLERISTVVAQREIDDTRAELEALREQQRVLIPKDTELIPLKAPVEGVISVANVRAGQVVTTRDTLFEIVDPHRLWIEAISGVDHGAPNITQAHATDPDGHSIKLGYVGRAPSLRQQTQPLQFKVEEQHEGLIIGSAVKVFVQQGEPIEGIVLPDDAVVRGPDGLPRVWAKETPQVFRPVPVRVAQIDGVNVLVLSGVEAGTRVVTEGAELINQVR